MKSFFELLKIKLSKKPTSAFDQRFWARFENEFGPVTTKLPTKRRLPSWGILALSSVASAAVVVFLILPFKRASQTDFNDVEVQTVHLAIQSEEMLNDLDLFLEFEDVAVEEADWDLLLNQGANNG